MKSRYFSFAGAAGVMAAAAMAGAGHTEGALAGPVNPPRAAAAAPVAAALPSFADLIERVSPAVVSIDIEGKAKPGQMQAFSGGSPQSPEDFFKFFGLPPGQAPQQQPPQPLRATGSGFFISDNGYIVTNNHVVEDADKITIRTQDHRTLDAKLVGRDPATDLAVVKVEGAGFPFVSFEERARPRVGDWVVAVGNPFNLGGTATAGIVSAIGRPNVSGSSYVDYMQIDAAINRGNSGGPTFDIQGRVVGVNSAIFTPSGGSVGIGFDIPADVAASVTRELIAHGKVTRGYIGATVQNVTPDIAASIGDPSAKGALVAEIVPDGPGAKAGLQPGDLIFAIDGDKVESASDLTRRVGTAKPGDSLSLDVRRAGKVLKLTLRSGVRPSEDSLAANDGVPPAEGEEGGLGLLVAPHEGGGVVIQKVAPGSDAADKGLKPGDIIQRAGDSKVSAPADVSAAVTKAKAEGRKAVLLLIVRDGRQIFIPVAIGKPAG